MRGHHRTIAVLAVLAACAASALAVVPPFLFHGLTGHYYDNPDFTGAAGLIVRDRAPDVTRARAAWFPHQYGIEWTGLVYVDIRGQYSFWVSADDGSQLWISDVLVVDSRVREAGRISLTRGFHPIRMRYVQTEGDSALSVFWRRDAGFGNTQTPERPFSSALLFPADPGSVVLTLSLVSHAMVNTLMPAGVVSAIAGLLAIAAVAMRSRRPAGRTTSRKQPFDARRVRQLGAYLVETGLIVTLAGLMGALLLRVRLPGGAAEFVASPYSWGLAGLLSLFLLRRWTRGAVLGGFELPPMVGRVLARWASRAGAAAESAARAPVRRNRFLGAALAAAVVIAGVVVAVDSAHGFTGVYLDEPDWTGAVLLTAHDRAPTHRRAVYDLINPDYLFSIVWTGVIAIAEAGDYEFGATAEGRALVLIGDRPIVDGRGGSPMVRASGIVRLGPGLHPITIRYAHAENRRPFFVADWRPQLAGRERRADAEPLATALIFPEDPGRTALVLARCVRASARFASALLGLAMIAVSLAGWHALLGWRRARLAEQHVHVALLLLLALVYAAGAFGAMPWAPGFSALRLLGPERTVAGLLTVLLALAAHRTLLSPLRRAGTAASNLIDATPLAMAGVAVFASLCFFYFRTEFVNQDGVMFRWLVPGLAQGERITFDEMWEFYLHARLWVATNWAWGWSVRLSYQVASCVAGGVFVVLVWRYARRLVPDAPLGFGIAMLSGGYMQLFFGDVENYTLVAVVILAYYLLSARCLDQERSVVLPSLALSVAMTFHLLAGFLLPSLAVLYVVAWRRREYRSIAAGLAVFVGVFAFTMVFLGQPLSSFYRGNWGATAIHELVTAATTGATGGSQGLRRWAAPAFDQYHWDVYNLLATMAPVHLLLIPLAITGRVRLDWVNAHLLAACAGMMLFQFGYQAMYAPIWTDWNLFANAPVPIAILAWRSLFQARSLRHHQAIAAGWVAFSFLHSGAWILSNRHYLP